MKIKVWNEFRHEQQNPKVAEIYPEGIHGAVAQALRAHLAEAQVTTATLDEADHGLPEAELEQTDVLFWWGHLAHHEVSDHVVTQVCRRVQQGMGLVVLHSAHLSKPFKRLMGTTCNLRWREADDRELVWSVAPQHPIARDVPQPLILEQHEMYGEWFDIPAPDELVFVSNFSGGEVFRSGCCFLRGKGRIFYFSPGHETYPIYAQAGVQKVLVNAARWVHQPHVNEIDTSTSPESPLGWYQSS